MSDVEKVLTEVRWILSLIVNGEPWSLKDAHEILAAFTADMPGAIGVCVRFAKAPMELGVGELRAALAKLEGK